MKMLITLLVLSFLTISKSTSQWTTPRVIDSTITASQSNPLIAVGPNRELAIVFNDGTGNGKLVCYSSSNLGNTFTRVLVDSGYYRPPWRWYYAGIPTSIGFDHLGRVILMVESSFLDDIVVFTNYLIGVLYPDSTRFSTVWNAVGTGGPGPPIMKKPTMSAEDTILHVLRGAPPSSNNRLIYTKLWGDRWTTQREYVMFNFQNSLSSYFDGKLFASSAAVHALVNRSFYQTSQRNSLFYSHILRGDSVAIPMIPIDTTYATSPRIVDMGSGKLGLLYAAGNGYQYSDSVLTARLFREGDTTFSSPFRLTAKPIRPVTSNYQSNSPVIHTRGANRHLVYRSYASSASVVAYYTFSDLQSPSLDSAFFTGYDYGDLALDSLGGKYLVMVGPSGKIYLTKKDVISPVQDVKSAPIDFALRQNYPNPFNPTTSISFTIAQTFFVRLKLFDVLGREVATLVNEKIESGNHQVVFDASQLSSGIYFYQLQAGSFFQTKKMVFLR